MELRICGQPVAAATAATPSPALCMVAYCFNMPMITETQTFCIISIARYNTHIKPIAPS
jgi:hypothetical protein